MRRYLFALLLLACSLLNLGLMWTKAERNWRSFFNGFSSGACAIAGLATALRVASEGRDS